LFELDHSAACRTLEGPAKGSKSPQPLFGKEGLIEAPPSTKGVGGIWFFYFGAENSFLPLGWKTWIATPLAAARDDESLSQDNSLLARKSHC
jgi:hypothetical protein